jgi:hypothetical protein
MGKLYAALGLLVIIGLGWWRYEYIVADRDAQKLRADNAVALVGTRDTELKAERKNASDAEGRALARYNEKEELQRDYDEKIKCINDRNCVVRMRWGSASCPTPSVHSTKSSTSRSDDLQVQDQRDFALWLADLERSIELDAGTIEGFKKELAIKSAPDYCKAK